MRAVIYARFSCSKQREASIDDQVRVCTQWCAREGHEVVATYSDYAMSGRTDDRPQFQEMIANAGESDLVVVYMMDRFSRDVYDAPIYKKQLRDRGVRVVSATESMPEGPESILMESIYEAMAAMESAHTSQRTRRGMNGNALKCMHNGVALFGYSLGDDGMYHVDEGQAALVRDAFLRRAGGESMRGIAARLARLGVRTAHGNPCNEQMVKRMLTNEKYRGVYSFGDVRVEGGMPAIVTAEEFMVVQGMGRRKPRSEEDWSDFPLSAKGICAECGSNLVGVSGRGYNGTKYTYYRCSRKCGCKPIRAEMMETSIVEELRKLLRSRNSALEIADAVLDAVDDKEAENRLSMAQKAISDADRGIRNILRAVEGGMDYSDVADRLAELKAQRAGAEADVALWQSRRIDRDDLADFLQYGSTLDDATLLRAFVWQVQLSDEMIVAVLNYDTEKCEAARISVPRDVRTTMAWQPSRTPIRTGYEVMVRDGLVAVAFPRP